MINKPHRISYLISRIDKIPIAVIIDKKKVRSNISGEIYLKVFLLNESPKIDIHFFNMVAESIKTTKGETGLLSFTLIPKETKITYNHKNGAFHGKFLVALHYPMIDSEKGWKLSKPDNFVPYVETFRVEIDGKFRKPLKPGKDKFESIRLSMNLDPVKGVLNQISNIRLEYFYFHFIWWLIAWCRNGSLSFTERRLLVQPVFIWNTNSVSPPTGWSFNTLLANANLIWAKCCIQFDARPPIYVVNSSYRVLTEDEMSNLRNEVNQSNAIEIFVVERFDPEQVLGGGATWGSGTANAKIITGDNQLPVNQNHLAHELGHVLGLDHPGSSDTLFPGCDDTIMEPSGFYADNPDEQCSSNCSHASNPLLSSQIRLCCQRPEL